MKKTLALLTMMGLAASANAAVVINEYLYDTDNAGNDAGEFIELYNNGGAPVDISGWTVLLVNGANGTAYSTVTVPAATSLAAGGYYVIGNAATIDAAYGVGTVDQNFNLDNILQNGAPDAIVLKDSGAALQDAVNYEGDGTFLLAGVEETNARSEGGTGLTRSRAIASTTIQVSNGRLPNGVDTGSNEADFANILATPGGANVDSISLPFTDNFSTVNPVWLYGFVPTRVIDPTTVTGLVASANGGNVLEIADVTGGGDANWIPASLGTVNVQGEIWIPLDNALPWSTGVGVGERNNPNWFSTAVGNGYENGFYLEYQNGPVAQKASIPAIVGPGGEARLIAVNSTPTLNTGATTAAAGTVLGTTTAMVKGAWNTFRIYHNQGGNRLYASINGTVIYDGVVPAGSNASGGVYVGFREAHTGSPVALSGEATYVDGIVINTTAPAANVDDWMMMND